jgi:hypothetical protein
MIEDMGKGKKMDHYMAKGKKKKQEKPAEQRQQAPANA